MENISLTALDMRRKGMTLQKIADLLGCNREKVRQHIARAENDERYSVFPSYRLSMRAQNVVRNMMINAGVCADGLRWVQGSLYVFAPEDIAHVFKSKNDFDAAMKATQNCGEKTRKELLEFYDARDGRSN